MVDDIVGESNLVIDFEFQHRIDFLNNINVLSESTPIVSGIDENYPNEVFGFSSWSPIVALILMNKSELLVTACQNKDYCNINGNYNKVTPLNYAILFSQTQMVDFLLNKLHADPTNCDKRGRCPLQIASNLPQKEIIELLLNTEQVHVNDQNQLGYTALHVAARKSNVVIARYLLENGADTEVYSHLDKNPIQLAAQFATNTQIMDELLKFYQIDILTNNLNQNLLHLAASQSNVLTTGYLIEKGVNPNALTNESLTPLHYAASFGNDIVIDLLLNTGKVNIEARDSLIGRTPLQHAIVISNIQAVRHLLIKGAYPKVRDNQDQSPLDLAAIIGSDVELIDLPLETGKVHVSDTDENGHTALHLAAKESNLLMARYLIEKGADPIATNRIGSTPLHIAAFFGEKTDVIDLLLENDKVNIDERRNDTSSFCGCQFKFVYCSLFN